MIKEAGFGDFLDQAIKDGRIKHAGFSFHDKLDLFFEIVDYYDWEFCQIQYNYMDEDFQAGTEGLKYAAKKGLGIAIMEPLRGGKLTNNLPEEVIRTFNTADIKRSPAEWALRWVLNHSEVAVALSGMSTFEQVEENLEIAKSAQANTMTEKEAEIIEQVRTEFKERIKVNCTACGYCMPCPAKVNISACFSHYNDFFVFGDPKTNDPTKSQYFTLGPKQKASNCIECGKCEEHCPQNILIRQELKKVKELFETPLS
jgi:predicted aldo/keto reductase-like oxidoreductase